MMAGKVRMRELRARNHHRNSGPLKVARPHKENRMEKNIVFSDLTFFKHSTSLHSYESRFFKSIMQHFLHQTSGLG